MLKLSEEQFSLLIDVSKTCAAAKVIELAKAMQIKEVENSPLQEVAKNLEDANNLFKDYPAPPVSIPSAPTFPNVPTPKKRVKARKYINYTNDLLDIIYDFAISKGYTRAIYPREPNPKKGKGYNAAFIINDQNVGIDDIDYSKLLEAKNFHRIENVKELKAKHWMAQFRHLNKLVTMMEKENKWPINVCSEENVKLEVNGLSENVILTLPRLAKCDSKQQKFLEDIYAATTLTGSKLTDIRDLLIKNNAAYSSKSLKAFDSAISKHLVEKYILREGKGETNRVIKRK